ncbi:laccase [Cyathus striatus]|nr:laccase [Cyathus striatus]
MYPDVSSSPRSSPLLNPLLMGRMFPSPFTFLALFASASLSWGASISPSSSLVISNDVVSPDGFQRSAIVAQGSFPAPLMKANKGDRFRVNVVNQLDDPTMLRGTSIHWHGILQRGSNWADGAAGITQCPIAPGHSFVYDFKPQAQSGTFWYHSHFGTQYCDGLRGPMVIYDPNDPYKHMYDVDDETTVITLADWFHEPAPSISGIPSNDATLINGIGRYPGGPKIDLAVVNVIRGKRYRMRLISIACDPNYMFSIDGHQLTIIEADGENVEPVTVDQIQIFTGQRYSFVLNANQPVGNYWIRSLPNSGKNNLTDGFDHGINSAILRYKGAPKSEPPVSKIIAGKLLEETDLHPLTNPAAPGIPQPGHADVNINLALAFNATSFKFSVNGTTFESPSVPVLLQILSGAQDARDLLPHGSVITLPRNKVIEVTIPEAGVVGGPHPFHLHGNYFSVVRSAGNNTPYNFHNPVRRDVVSIGEVKSGSEVTIRFTTDNPGPWIFHCHIDFHLQGGLGIVFVADEPHVKQANPVPDSWKQLCPIYDALNPPSDSPVTSSPVSSSANSPSTSSAPTISKSAVTSTRATLTTPSATSA